MLNAKSKSKTISCSSQKPKPSRCQSICSTHRVFCTSLRMKSYKIHCMLAVYWNIESRRRSNISYGISWLSNISELQARRSRLFLKRRAINLTHRLTSSSKECSWIRILLPNRRKYIDRKQGEYLSKRWRRILLNYNILRRARRQWLGRARWRQKGAWQWNRQGSTPSFFKIMEHCFWSHNSWRCKISGMTNSFPISGWGPCFSQ